MHSARAQASPNIALVKYWGNRGEAALRLAASGSISITLGGLMTEIEVTFDEGLEADQLRLNGQPAQARARERTSRFLDAIRGLSGLDRFAAVESQTNFPVGAGIASSAAAFAALALAGSRAAGMQLPLPDLSRLARLGSGSACRSVYGGFVEWIAGDTHDTSLAQPLHPPEHWPLVDLVAVIDEQHKPVGSTEGHALASTSPLQQARLNDAPSRLNACRRALDRRDFEGLARVVELDSNMMHAVMLTSTPPLAYWQPPTLSVMALVGRMRRDGVSVCYTIDAGPTVHCLCEPEQAELVAAELSAIPGVRRVLRAQPGAGARLIDGSPRPG